MRFPFFLLYVFIAIPERLRDLVYDYVAANRYKYGICTALKAKAVRHCQGQGQRRCAYIDSSDASRNLAPNTNEDGHMLTSFRCLYVFTHLLLPARRIFHSHTMYPISLHSGG